LCERLGQIELPEFQMSEKPKEDVLFAPITDVPYPRLDFEKIIDPVPAIIAAPEFAETRRFFGEAPSASRSLLPDVAQALLYSVIRNLRPDHVVEIGTYRGGTAETLSRALEANRHGMLHTVSPFDAERFGPTFAQWPEPLRARTKYHPVNSMEFFIEVAARRLQLGVVLVDGNHDFEFAAFDIWSAARGMMPGGFIFVDNISQFGPYRAGREFLSANPGWRDCGTGPDLGDESKPFDPGRYRIPYTDFFVFRAPLEYFVGRTPKTFGEINVPGLDVKGLTIVPASQNQVGRLKVQCILRAFSEARLVEILTEAECVLDGRSEPIQIKFDRSWQTERGFDHYSVEPWLYWIGERPLELKRVPTPF
jgi:hypothetical protein